MAHKVLPELSFGSPFHSTAQLKFEMAGTWKSRTARFHKAATEVRKLRKQRLRPLVFLILKVSGITQEVSWPWSRPDWAVDSPTQVKGQIIATSHDLTRNGGLVRIFVLFQGNVGW